MRGGSKDPPALYAIKWPIEMKFHGPKLVDFYFMGFRKAMVKKKLNFFGGTPRSGPLKILKLQNFQKVTPMTSYNPIFLLQNHLVLSKLGCLQKTRAQNIKIWTNGGHFCNDKGFLWSPRSIFKKNYFSAIFEIFLNFFFDSGQLGIGLNV